MRRTLPIVAFMLLATLSASAQDPVTGFPPYGSFHESGVDTVNRQNLNVNFATRVVSAPARGMDFRFALVYDSLIWKKASNAWLPVANQDGTPTWGWTRQSPTGSILYKTTTATLVVSRNL